MPSKQLLDVVDGHYLPDVDLVRYAVRKCETDELRELSARMHEMCERWWIAVSSLDLEIEIRELLEAKLETRRR
jgi:hypothetical protein